MKRFLLTILFISFSGTIIFSQNTRISVADGLGTNPLVWNCSCLPFPNDSIIINHDIILNVDFGFTDGAVVINPGGSLVGDSPNRNFAFSTSANFINNGVFDVARVGFFGGSAYNGGTFTSDSFYTEIITNPGWVSNGDMHINYSYWNTGKFHLGVGAELIVNENFYNGDSLISGVNAVLINDGAIRVDTNFANSDTMRGVGQVCIFGASVNLGVITGTLDMCDVTGGGPVDYNFGTISGSVTTCTGACNIGIQEFPTISLQVFPNPVLDVVEISGEHPFELRIYDMTGKLLMQYPEQSSKYLVEMGSWSSGTYFYKAISEQGTNAGRLIKE